MQPLVIKVDRLFQVGLATVGSLSVDGAQVECFTLEDCHRVFKVPGQTRIPAGTYEVKLRTFGGLNLRYQIRYDWHQHGMLWLQDVPGFTDILIHSGNNVGDTAGCILVGDGALASGELTLSVRAYQRVYTRAVSHLASGGRVRVRVRDERRAESVNHDAAAHVNSDTVYQ